jgi:NAD(P)H-hydrate epimerase
MTRVQRPRRSPKRAPGITESERAPRRRRSRGGTPAEASASTAYRPRPAPELPDDAHKGDAGRVLCVCGSRDMPGAAVLVARAAQRAGAGLVTVACLAEELRIILPTAAPEAILLDWTHAFADARAASMPELRSREDHARVVGPGLGRTARTLAIVSALLADGFRGPTVLDADALNVVAGDLEIVRGHAGPLVSTPHPGEAARLLGRPIPRDEAGRIAAAREISRRTRGVCCLKGHRTVVADGEQVYVNTTGNPGMATAGAGDVLAGILSAYLAACATGIDARWKVFDAAAAAVHVHGLAGDLAAERFSRRGVIASDLIDFLPAAQLRFREPHGLH